MIDKLDSERSALASQESLEVSMAFASLESEDVYILEGARTTELTVFIGIYMVGY